MEEYIRLLLEQVRCKKAHPMIEKELRCHLEDQIEANLSDGMDGKAAEEAAVRDMGSAVEVGVSMDRIHRPKTAWGMIGMMALVMMIAIGLQYSFHDTLIKGYQFTSFVKSSFIGFGIMILVYWLDYTYLVKWAKQIALVIIGICLATLLFGQNLNGVRYWIPYTSFSLQSFMLLYVPAYGAVIYRYRGEKCGGIIKALIWMLIPVFLTLRIPSASLAFMLYISMLFLLTMGIWKNWFQVRKCITTVILWGILIGMPILAMIAGFPFLADYQKARIMGFWKPDQAPSYMTGILRDNLINSKLIGTNGMQLSEYLPDVKSDFFISYITGAYGILAATLLCGLFAVLLVAALSVCSKQKNQAGMMIGTGSISILALTAIMNVLENLGMFPLTWTFLPFFSDGTSGIVICYIMIGFILSIYRYKDIYPKEIEPADLKKNSTFGYRISIEKTK